MLLTTETGFDPSGDGYDYLEHAGAWRVRSAWGSDGWDLGDWPYVMIFTRDETDRYGIQVRCEGDLTTKWYDVRAERDAEIDAQAHYWWKRDPERYGLEGADLSDPCYHGPPRTNRPAWQD